MVVNKIPKISIQYNTVCVFVDLDTDQMLLGLWCLTPRSAIFQLYRGVSCIRAGNRSTRKKPLTCN